MSGKSFHSLPLPMNARSLFACGLAVLCSICPGGVRGAEKGPDVDGSLTEFVQGFKGRGQLTDESKPLTPEETLQHFKLAPGLQMEVVAHEPTISQPLNLHFDERGRLWV